MATANLIENRTFDEIAVGDTASLTRTLTADDIQLFAAVSEPDSKLSFVNS